MTGIRTPIPEMACTKNHIEPGQNISGDKVRYGRKLVIDEGG
jgi:hypothetical protein